MACATTTNVFTRLLAHDAKSCTQLWESCRRTWKELAIELFSSHGTHAGWNPVETKVQGRRGTAWAHTANRKRRCLVLRRNSRLEVRDATERPVPVCLDWIEGSVTISHRAPRVRSVKGIKGIQGIQPSYLHICSMKVEETFKALCPGACGHHLVQGRPHADQ